MINYGLLFLALAWIYLFYVVWKKGQRGLALWFLRLYIVGALIIFLNTFRSVTSWNSLIAFAGFLAPLLVLWKIQR